MQKYDIHFCLISAQAAPNLLPILDKEFKPKQSIFLVSPQMKEKANFLKKTFEDNNVKVSLEMFDDITDFESMDKKLIALLDQYEHQTIALNVTGGTKLMAIAAQNAFAIADQPIFYVDTDRNNIIFISKDNNNQWLANLPINAKNDLKTYLSAYGFSVLSKKINIKEEWLGISENFIRHYDKYKNNIPLLNKYASQSESNGFKTIIDNKSIVSFNELLDELKYNYKIIEFYDNKVDFKNRNNKEFLNGAWLEEYTYQILSTIPSIDDIAYSLEVGNEHYKQSKHQLDKDNLGNQNEFDLAFIAKNKFHIIECKTQLMGKGNGVKVDDILYKLETLKDYGGLMTKKCLVTYFEVPDSVKNRAKQLKIEIIQGKDLQRLKNKIQEWISK